MSQTRSQDKQNPIFVVGYMHSGTTLLMSILASHPSIYSSKGETKFFELSGMIQAKYPDISNSESFDAYIRFVVQMITKGFSVREDKMPEIPSGEGELVTQIKNELGGKQDYLSVFEACMKVLASNAKKSRWMEKTPTHIFHTETIRSTIPNALFVEIVRDPRDVLASKKTRRADVSTDRYKAKERYFKKLEKAYDPLWDTLSWSAAIRAGMQLEQKHPLQHYRIRYEDLVQNPRQEIIALCEFLGIPFLDELLAVEHHNPADIKSKQASGISQDSVERWKSVLSLPEVSVIQRLAKLEMKTLAYERAAVPLASQVSSIGLYARSALEFFSRLYRRWKLGGTQFLREVLKNYLKRLRSYLRFSS
jgi:hypothetical protein